MKLRVTGLIAGVVACFAFLGTGGAYATTVTIGSPLPPTLVPDDFGTSRTVTPVALPEPGAIVSAPADGVIVSWKVSGASGGPLFLRVVHPLGGNLFTGTGTASSGTIPGTGFLTFQANLPILQGDLIGIDPTSDSDQIGIQTGSGQIIQFSTPLGSMGQAPTGPPAAVEVGFNAQVLLNCIVPNLKGKKVGAARKALAAAGCAAPRLKPKKKAARKGLKFVKKQKPAAGTEIRGDAAEILTLAREKK